MNKKKVEDKAAITGNPYGGNRATVKYPKKIEIIKTN
jgi:hypothetical protein